MAHSENMGTDVKTWGQEAGFYKRRCQEPGAPAFDVVFP